MNKFIFIAIFLSSSLLAAETCQSNKNLVTAGFIQHDSSEFASIHKRLQKEISGPTIRTDLDLVFGSIHLEKPVHFQSWDDLKTPDLEMMGDIVFYSDIDANNTFEIRWYEMGKKHFVISTSQCSCDDVPLADNALF